MTVKPWQIVSTRREASYRIFDLRVDCARSPRTHRAHEFYVLESRDWVNVIPLTPGGEVVLIRQYRHGSRKVTLEIPGGLVEDGDTPEIAAGRELREETGYRSPRMVHLGTVDPNPAFLNNRCHTYLAEDARVDGDQALDEKEDIEVLLEPLDKIPSLIGQGAISHSLVVAAFYHFFARYGPGR